MTDFCRDIWIFLFGERVSVDELYPISKRFGSRGGELGCVVVEFSDMEQGVVAGVCAELVVGRVDAISEGSLSLL